MNRYAALAMHVVRDAIRKNIVVLVVIFVLMAVLASTVLPFGTVEDHVKLTLKWNLWMMLFIGTIAAVFMAATNVGRDIEDRTVYTILTKPVRKVDIILARFLGFEIVMLLLLIPMAVVSYGLIKMQASKVPLGPDSPPALCALAPVRADNISQTHAYQEQEGESLQKDKDKRYYLLYGTDSRQSICYDFKNLDVASFDDFVTIGIQPNITSKESKVPPKCGLVITVVNGDDPQKSERITIPTAENGRKSFIRVKRSVFEGSNSAQVIITKDITDDIAYNSLYDILTVAMNMGKLELIPEARSFLGNYVTSMFMVFLSFSLITLVAICASTFLTGPVAILFSFFIFFCGAAMEVIKTTVEVLGPGRLLFQGSLSWQVDTQGQGGRLIHFMNDIIRYFLNGITVVLPHFSIYNTTEFLVHNQMVPREQLIWGIGQFGIFGAILFLIAATIFHFREVAK